VTGSPILAIDTATSRAVVALGSVDGQLIAADAWPAEQRHSEELLPRIDALLRRNETRPTELAGIVVGTGPGAFTGLRVGLATAKTLAHELGLPIAGVSSAEALLRAAAEVAAEQRATQHHGRAGTTDGGELRPVLVLPAGSTDRILVRPGAPPQLLPGGSHPHLEADERLLAVDLAGRADDVAVAWGAAALDGLAAAILTLGAARLTGGADDVDTLVPEYVTLPRGIREVSGAIAWSRDHR
jgi:tRNA threonylcarbamoyl adenosine modification protein YeaZ